MTSEPRNRLLRVLGSERVPQEQRMVVRPGYHELGCRRCELFVPCQSLSLGYGGTILVVRTQKVISRNKKRTFCFISRLFAFFVIRSGPQNEISVERDRVDPMRVLVQTPDQLALRIIERSAECEESLSALNTCSLAIPKLDGSVTAGRENDTLATPSHSVDAGGVPTEREFELAQFRVPDSHGRVL